MNEFGRLERRPRVQNDVDRAVESWHRLLEEIDSQAHPGSGEESYSTAPMVPQDVLERYKSSSFLKSFMAKARAPRHGVGFIAPGIAVFNDENLVGLQERWLADLRTPWKEQLLKRITENQESDTAHQLVFPSAQFGQVPAYIKVDKFDRPISTGTLR